MSGYTLPDWAQGDWGEVQVAGGRLVYRDTENYVQHTGEYQHQRSRIDL